MDYTGIVQRAVDTTRRHRALWVVGFLWMLAGGGSGGGGFGNGLSNSFSGSGDRSFGGPDRPGPRTDGFDSFGPDLGVVLVALAVAILVVVTLIFVAVIAQYVFRAGVYRGLDRVENEGWQPTVREIWRLGWQRRTWRLFFQDIVVGIPFAVVLVVAFVVALSPLLLLISGDEGLRVVGIVGTVLLIILWVFALIVASIVIGIWTQFWQRAAVVDDQGVFASLSTGVALARRNAPDVIKMWLLMVGVSIAWTIVFLMLIALFMAVVFAVAGVPAYLLYQSTDSLPLALAYGLPVGIVLFFVPTFFVGGLYLIFEADVWGIVYRELVGRRQALLHEEPSAAV